MMRIRCLLPRQTPEVRGRRINVAATLRGIDSFKELWRRRKTPFDPEISELNLLSCLI